MCVVQTTSRVTLKKIGVKFLTTFAGRRRRVFVSWVVMKSLGLNSLGFCRQRSGRGFIRNPAIQVSMNSPFAGQSTVTESSGMLAEYSMISHSCSANDHRQRAQLSRHDEQLLYAIFCKWQSVPLHGFHEKVRLHIPFSCIGCWLCSTASQSLLASHSSREELPHLSIGAHSCISQSSFKENKHRQRFLVLRLPLGNSLLPPDFGVLFVFDRGIPRAIVLWRSTVQVYIPFSNSLTWYITKSDSSMHSLLSESIANAERSG